MKKFSSYTNFLWIWMRIEDCGEIKYSYLIKRKEDEDDEEEEEKGKGN